MALSNISNPKGARAKALVKEEEDWTTKMKFKAEMNKKEKEILALQAEREALQAALAEASKNIMVESSSAGAAEETTKARAEAYQEGVRTEKKKKRKKEGAVLAASPH